MQHPYGLSTPFDANHHPWLDLRDVGLDWGTCRPRAGTGQHSQKERRRSANGRNAAGHAARRKKKPALAIHARLFPSKTFDREAEKTRYFSEKPRGITAFER